MWPLLAAVYHKRKTGCYGGHHRQTIQSIQCSFINALVATLCCFVDVSLYTVLSLCTILTLRCFEACCTVMEPAVIGLVSHLGVTYLFVELRFSLYSCSSSSSSRSSGSSICSKICLFKEKKLGNTSSTWTTVIAWGQGSGKRNGKVCPVNAANDPKREKGGVLVVVWAFVEFNSRWQRRAPKETRPYRRLLLLMIMQGFFARQVYTYWRMRRHPNAHAPFTARISKTSLEVAAVRSGSKHSSEVKEHTAAEIDNGNPAKLASEASWANAIAPFPSPSYIFVLWMPLKTCIVFRLENH